MLLQTVGFRLSFFMIEYSVSNAVQCWLGQRSGLFQSFKGVAKVIHLLVLVLNKPECQSEILRVFHEVGVKGATIIDSVGMGRAKAEHYLTPLVAGLMRVLDDGHNYNKTILAVIEDEAIMQRAVEEADRIVDFSQPGSGIIFTVPVDLVRGMRSD